MDASKNITDDESFQNSSSDEYCKALIQLVRSSQKYSNDLQGWHHFSDYSDVNNTMNKINQLIYRLISALFLHQDIKLDIKNCNLKEKLEVLREGNDALLEKINFDFDEAKGIKRHIDNQIVDTNIQTIRSSNRETGREVVLVASRNVQKPQLFFDPKIDNSTEPFIPTIKDKPNSIKPLSIMLCSDENGLEYFSHPYEYELHNWTVDEEFLKLSSSRKPKSLEQTPLKMIQDVVSLEDLVKKLKKCREFAVDVEHHSFRSYQGLTCLIQISTREEDYIIDPFPIRNQLHLLNEVFTDRRITKVLHGSDYDVLWLQRDCGIYLVNMFDTHQAAIVLEYPHRSLGNLLLNFCSVSVNKTYQRADWRIRPLPEDFLEYARSDSHYLLYIYDLMRNELIEKGNEFNNLLRAVYDRSTELCLKRYEKPIVKPDSHLEMYRRSKKFFNNRQLYALQQLYSWRDRTARQHDESVEFVLPKHMLMQIAEILPKEMQGILACCNPIPPLVKTEQLTLHQIVRDARESHPDQIDMNLLQDQTPRYLELKHTDEEWTSALKHDLSSTAEEADPKGLPTLLNPQETLMGDLFVEDVFEVQLVGKSSLFGVPESILNVKKFTKVLVSADTFLTPFARYSLMLTHLQSENELAKKQQKSTNQIEKSTEVLGTEDMIRIRRRRQQSPVDGPEKIDAKIADPPNSESTTEEQLQQIHCDRIARLQQQIESLISDAREVSDKMTSLHKSKANGKKTRRNAREQCVQRTDDTSSSCEQLLELPDHKETRISPSQGSTPARNVPSAAEKRKLNPPSLLDHHNESHQTSQRGPGGGVGDNAKLLPNQSDSAPSNIYSNANFDVFHRKRQKTNRSFTRRNKSRGFSRGKK